MNWPSKSRSCPSCTHPVPWSRLWLKPWSWAEWPCPNCGATLGFNGKRRTLVALVSSPFLAVGLVLAFRGTYWPALICLPTWLWLWTYDAVDVKFVPSEQDG